jgi:hypothetical protein
MYGRRVGLQIARALAAWYKRCVMCDAVGGCVGEFEAVVLIWALAAPVP